MTAAPAFTVVVPTRRRPERLAACLAALARVEYPSDRFEVVVVDDGTRPLEPVAAAVAAAPAPLRVRLVVQEHAGPAAARNRGAAAAGGELLAFTDDDCRPDPCWLRALAAALNGAPRAAAGGLTVNGLPGNLFSAASQLLVDHVYDYFRAAGRPFLASNNLALPRALFAELGGFDAGFPLAAGEDRELCDRALGRGAELRFAPDAVIRHYHRLGPGTFTRQHFHYGRGAWHFHALRAGRGSGRVRVEPARFYAGLVLLPFRRRLGLRALPLSLLLLWTQAVNAAGFFHERRRARAQLPARSSSISKA